MLTMVSVIKWEIQIKPKYISPKFRAGQCFFISYPLPFENLNVIKKWKRTLLWLKNENAENLKIKYQQRGVKLKWSIAKNAILN